MPRNVYSDIKLHLTWHTKESRFLIKPEMVQTVHDAICKRATAADGVVVHEIGGTMNHVHLAVTVPPTLLVSEWIGKVKGGSAHDLNELPIYSGGFQWQTGYGVVSFSSRALPWVKKYIRNQKQHHKQETIKEVLERITRTEA